MDYIRLTIDEENSLEIPKRFSKYTYVRSIGHGSFSAVVLVQHIQSKEFFACKVVSRELLVNEGLFERFEQEVRILQSLHHPNIVQVTDIVFTDKLILLLMENCENGELFNHIVQCGALNDEELTRIFRQITRALQYVHEKNIAHRDLKPENILLDDEMNAKLADFGLCHITSPKSLLKTPCGSPFYAPPEIINNVKYDGKKADIWSLGVVLFTMATGALPWTETNQSKLFLQIQEADIHIPSCLSPPLQQLLLMMLCKDPNARPSCEEILNMPWLAEDEDEVDMRLASRLSSSRIRSKLSKSGKCGASVKSTDDAWRATHSSNYKKPIDVRPRLLTKNATNTVSQAAVMAPIASLVRKVPPSGKRKP
ncbi:CAMK family protein kinase [Tritrichomonas foetus]|uniref:CAMK family protein kinase n=1 Tax=Tritrichomonas foetus TaxID=1144522 RepID=A0A1J4JJ55_9EUKA|nr:CAMK family protein kinase [Tritrichomonas foetus]|eukprot:OHS99198.1 CAMK family protein kinase [Tritrichomonas foetus]